MCRRAARELAGAQSATRISTLSAVKCVPFSPRRRSERWIVNCAFPVYVISVSKPVPKSGSDAPGASEIGSGARTKVSRGSWYVDYRKP